MLRFLIGRAGSGKSTFIYRAIAQNAKRGKKKQILLVPEQYSHAAERMLCESGGDAISLSAEVLTFRSLATRVLTSEGGIASRTIDDGGRLILMKKAFDAAADLLFVYSRVSRKTEFLKKLLSAVTELKSYRVEPSALLEAASDASDASVEKLRDLAYIYEAYEALLEGELRDPNDILSLVEQKLSESDYLSEYDIYIDGFDGFTPAEYAILRQMFVRSELVTLALSCDYGEFLRMDYTEEELFAPVYECAKTCLALCEKHGVSCETVPFLAQYRIHRPALAFLESRLFDYGTSGSGESPDGLSLCPVHDKRAECEAAAALILDWTAKGIRYRDVTVVCRNLNDYRGELDAVFSACGIPVFIDRLSSITEKPLFVGLLSAFRIVNFGFRLDDMIAYIKSGFCGLPAVAADLLEEYCEVWQIRPGKWTQESAWSGNPEGFLAEETPYTQRKLRLIDKIRRKISAPLRRFAGRAGGTRSVRDFCEALFSYSAEIRLDKLTEQRAKRLEKEGNLRLSDEYEQLWQLFCDLLDQLVFIMGDSVMRFEEFSSLFELLLSVYQVGVIPTTVDCVTTADAERARYASPKKLIVLGMNEGVFPKTHQSEGIITDGERLMLAQRHRIRLAPTDAKRIFEEQLLLYRTLFSSSDEVVLFYQTGRQSLPSNAVERIRALFPALEERTVSLSVHPSLCLSNALCLGRQEVKAALLQSEDTARLLDRAEKGREFVKKPIRSPALLEGLYGSPLRLTPTRIENFHSCRFAYFMRYGLGIRALRRAEFAGAETGTFYHYVLENTSAEVKASGGWRACGRDRAIQTALTYANLFAKKHFPSEEEQTARFRTLFRRLCEQMAELVGHMHDELSISDFEPIAFERRFGEGANPPLRFRRGERDLTVTGQVDRVDAWEEGGKRYLRVIDYKTGVKKFSFTELYHGLQLQLPLYLFSILGENDVPAGFLYLPMRTRVSDLPKHTVLEEIEAEREKTLRYSGLVLKDDAVIRAMEKGLEREGRFIPVSFTASGELAKRSAAFDEELLAKTGRHIENLLFKMESTLMAGRIEANPCVAPSSASCDFCEFHSICRIDIKRPKTGDEPRFVKGMTSARFAEALDAEEEAGGGEIE